MKTKLFITLVLFVCFLIFIFFVFTRNASKEKKEPLYISIPTRIPLSSPTLSPAITPPIQTTKDNLVTLMPVITPEFTIEYHPSSDTFTVTIRKSPYEESRIKSEQWLLEHGVRKDDYQEFKIGFISQRYLD